MYRQLRQSTFFLLLVGYSMPGVAAIMFATDSINMIRVLQGQHAPKTVSESMVRLILEHSREKDHVPVSLKYFSSDRINRLLLKDLPVCAPLKLKTPERQKQFLFSLPVGIYLPRHLYQLAASDPIPDEYLTDKGELMSLKDYFDNHPDKVILTISGHSYGANLDKQISELRPDSVFVREGNEPYEAYIDMLVRQRVDFILLYQGILNSNRRKTLRTRDYAIRGERMTSGFIMCNDTPESRAFLASVDGAISSLVENGKMSVLLSQFFEGDVLQQVENEYLNRVRKAE